MPPDDATPARPKLCEILTGAEMEGLADDAGMSGLDIAKLLAPLAGMPAAGLHVAMEAGGALGRRFGFKASKSAETILATSYPVAVRSLVFALHGLGHELTVAFDTPSGAYVEATLCADLLAAAGTLQFDLVDAGGGAVRIKGVSEIKGQMFDWGKGKRALAAVFEKADAYGRRMGG